MPRPRRYVPPSAGREASPEAARAALGGPGRPANPLSRAQVDALHEVYLCWTAERERPWSVREIAEQWWRPLSYSTPGAAVEGIRKEFHRRGLALRGRSETAALAAQAPETGPSASSRRDEWMERRAGWS